ncbi:hypothetical protein, partial [Paracoccus lutimaris]|uniref:hypothetical protein n=1 Tax=Paracoccus lutimaris TaxID=1490030 RepID=UPI001C69DE51
PAGSSRGKVAHGSILNDNFRCCRVKSQWQSTPKIGMCVSVQDIGLAIEYAVQRISCKAWIVIPAQEGFLAL